MTSEIRANTLKNRVGLGTVSFTNTGPVVSGIVTIANSTTEGVTLEDNAGVGNSLKITTPTGYVSIGSGNAAFVHFNTDRGSYYFQKRIIVDEGIIGSYDENLTLQSPLNTNRVTINKDTGLFSILNDLDVDGHTNLDNVNIVGITTTTSNIEIKGNNKYLKLGASDQFAFVTVGGQSFITNSTGHLTSRSASHTWENLAGNTEYLRIASNGRVGINTTNPQTTLYSMNEIAAGDGNRQFIGMEAKTVNGTPVGEIRTTYYSGASGAYPQMRFVTSDTERLRIGTDGKIGIQTTTGSGLINTLNGGTNQQVLHIRADLGSSNGRSLNLYTPDTDNTNAPFRFQTGNGYVFQCDSENVFTVAHDRRIGINQLTPTADLEVCPSGTSTSSTIFIHAPTHNTNVASEAILKFGYGHSGSPDAVGHIKMIEDATNSFDGDFVFNLPTNNQSGGSTTNERLRLDSHGRLIVGGGTHAGGSALVVKGGNQNTYSTIGMFSNHTNPTNNTLLSQIRCGSNGTAVGADIRVYADADWGNNDYPSRIEFHTTPDGSNSKQVRLKITSGGAVVANNFGIGVDNRWKIRPNSSYNNLALEYSTGTSLADTNIKAEFYNTGNVRFSTNTGAANGLKIYQNSIESQIYTAHFPELLTGPGNPNPTGSAEGRMPYSTISGNNVTIAANTYYVAMAGRKFYLPALSSTTINNNCSLYFDLNTMSYVNNASGIIESTVTRIVLYYNAQSGTGALGRIVPLCNKMNLMAVKKMYISCVTATTDQYEYNNGSVDTWRGDLWQTTGAANANNGSDYVRYLYQNNGYSLVESRYYLYWGRSPRAFNQYVNEGYMETGSRDSYNFGTGASQFWMQGASYWASGGVGSCLDLGVQTIVHA